MRTPIRRVVTETGADGRSTITSDAASSAVIDVDTPSGALVVTELWALDAQDPVLDGADPVTNENGVRTELQRANVAWRTVEFPPGSQPFMHATPTLDLNVVVSGRLVMILEDGSHTELGPGDTVVQRNTVHAWSNPGNEPCVLLSASFGLVDPLATDAG